MPHYFQHLMEPNTSLANILHKQSPLEPTLVTDAKALYDSYHRESFSSGLTDKRTGLEIKGASRRSGSPWWTPEVDLKREAVRRLPDKGVHSPIAGGPTSVWPDQADLGSWLCGGEEEEAR